MNIYKKVFGFICIVVATSGCVSTTPESTSVLLPNSKPLVFAFKSDKDLTKAAVLNELSKQIISNSQYKPKYREVVPSNNSHSYVKGVSVSIENNVINLNYVNGLKYVKLNHDTVTTQTLKYEVKFEQNAAITKVTLLPPASYSLQPKKNLLFMPIEPYLTESELKNDFAKINSRIAPSIKVSKKSVGEFDVKFKNDAVNGNFSRLLEEYDYRKHFFTFELKKGKVYKFINGGSEKPVKIAVYPYRNGSKVQYEFNTHFKLMGDGTSTYSQRNTDKLVALIKDIARD